ncbi:hypothetical protein [Breoghania sp. L-A4]|uniref:hypothetical protein n=1 Tax=Breoghania sp. L-A4 TaxID=2304600 RepID=UPI0013C33B14|nr:hypothetical protein [Breoghania sp. L-A4]
MAFAILAMMLAMVYRTVGAGARGVERAEHVAGALELLQSELDRLATGPALAVGTDTASMDETFGRTLRIGKVALADASPGDPQASLYRIEIAAFRKTDPARPVLALSAMRLQRDPP